MTTPLERAERELQEIDRIGRDSYYWQQRDKQRREFEQRHGRVANWSPVQEELRRLAWEMLTPSLQLDANEQVRIAEMLITAAERIDAEGEWIACSDQLPPQHVGCPGGTTVLVATAEGHVLAAWYSVTRECWLTAEGSHDMHQPTHWRPLPKTPQ